MICLGYLYAIGYGTEKGEAVAAEVNTGISKRAIIAFAKLFWQ
jgi:hypothetical protein